MSKIRIYYLLVATLLLWSCDDEPMEELENERISTPSLKVSSFNIRFDNASDESNSWINRRENVLSFLLIEEMDVIGMQEVLNSQIQFLDENLRDYERVGVGRDDGETAGEYAPIYYKSDRFELLGSGNFWLSESPSIPSIGWDAVLKRICTYVHLLDKESNQEIYFYNTHFDHIGSTARFQSAALIRDSIEDKRAENIRVILTCDLNGEPGSATYEVLNEIMTDSFESDIRLGPLGTFNGFNLEGPHNRRIDFIFSTGFKPLTYESVSTAIDDNYLSDHFPVISKLEYRPVNYQ